MEVMRLGIRHLVTLRISVAMPPQHCLNGRHNCRPHLFKLPPRRRWKRPERYRAVGVRDIDTIQHQRVQMHI